MIKCRCCRHVYTVHMHTVCPRCYTLPTGEQVTAALAATEPKTPPQPKPKPKPAPKPPKPASVPVPVSSGSMVRQLETCRES